jgi:hypothetical protein
VNDAEGMCFGQRFADLHHTIDGFGDRQASTPLQAGTQIAALHVLEHQIGNAMRGSAHVEDVVHVLGAQPRGYASFGQQAADDLFVAGVLGPDQLDGDGAVELEVRRPQNHPHAAFGDALFDSILLAQKLTWERAVVSHATARCSSVTTFVGA